MFNGNKFEKNEIKVQNGTQDNQSNQNHQYIYNGNDNDYLSNHQKDNSLEYQQNYNINNINNEENSYLNNNYRKMSLNSSERQNSYRLSSRNNEKMHNTPNYLINMDLNKLSLNNHKNIDISLLSSNSFINNNNYNRQNNNNKKDISPEKYLDEILKKNETEIQNNYNKIIIQTLSSENNDNNNQNISILTNSIKSSSEFDFFKNTLNKNKNENKNNINKKNRLKGLIYEEKESTENNNNYIDNSIKIVNHDDIPIIANTSSFMELVEKELANENLNNSNNNKSFDILPSINSKNKNFDKNEKGVKIIKIINKKNENKEKQRSKTPDNLVIRRFTKKKK